MKAQEGGYFGFLHDLRMMSCTSTSHLLAPVGFDDLTIESIVSSKGALDEKRENASLPKVRR